MDHARVRDQRFPVVFCDGGGRWRPAHSAHNLSSVRGGGRGNQTAAVVRRRSAAMFERRRSEGEWSRTCRGPRGTLPTMSSRPCRPPPHAENRPPSPAAERTGGGWRGHLPGCPHPVPDQGRVRTLSASGTVRHRYSSQQRHQPQLAAAMRLTSDMRSLPSETVREMVARMVLSSAAERSHFACASA